MRSAVPKHAPVEHCGAEAFTLHRENVLTMKQDFTLRVYHRLTSRVLRDEEQNISPHIQQAYENAICYICGDFSLIQEWLCILTALPQTKSCQHILGRSSPPGGGSSVSEPIAVRTLTRPGMSSVTSPITAASAEYLPFRRTLTSSSALSAGANITSLPSHARYYPALFRDFI